MAKDEKNGASVSSLLISWKHMKAEARGPFGIIAILIILGALTCGLGVFQS